MCVSPCAPNEGDTRASAWRRASSKEAHARIQLALRLRRSQAIVSSPCCRARSRTCAPLPEQGVTLVQCRCRSEESHLCGAAAEEGSAAGEAILSSLSWQSSSCSSFGQRIYRCHRLRLPFSGTLQRQEHLIQTRVSLREQAGKAPVCLPEGKPTIYLLCALKRLRT